MIKIRTLIAALLFLPALCWAQLTSPQMTTLRTTCAADQTCNGLMQSADDVGMAAWFNVVDAAYIVWRTSVTDREIMQDSAFDWTRVDNLTAGKSRIWEYMFKFGAIDPSNANIRAGIDATWVGTAADLAVRASVYAKCKRSATRAEKALASGAGTTASPSALTFSGSITYIDASNIRSL